LTKYERILGLEPRGAAGGAAPTPRQDAVGVGVGGSGASPAAVLDEFIESLQYVDESPDGHSGGEGDNTQGSNGSQVFFKIIFFFMLKMLALLL